MLLFNTLLTAAGIDPADVRLLRHLPRVGGRSLLDVWRGDQVTFDAWQAFQPVADRKSFARPYWASFIGMWDGRTVFVGLYEVLGREEKSCESLEPEVAADPLTGRVYDEATMDRYLVRPADELGGYAGRLYVEWGGGASGKRAWKQRADAQDKPITELHLDRGEEPFPGLLAINAPLSRLSAIPPSWIEHLAAAKGVYLLSCPHDGGRYVGSATAAGGFWARWSEYLSNGHGGNAGMVARPPSDFYATILQVAGSTDTSDDILSAETRWKEKLRTREWGLNRN